jgi:hypothetical protein
MSRRKKPRLSLVLPLAALATILLIIGLSEAQEQPFGTDADVSFAKSVWTAMDDYSEWPIRTDFYEGRSPHGEFLRTYYNIVTIDGTPYHVIAKDNYGGEGATMETVSESPHEYLASATIMVQRHEGYDPDNNDWFWVKYNSDGTIAKNAKGMALAGRVAKGADKGCIACHASAKDGDYLFSNDR